MEKIVESALLYDFYGDLLTAHQKDIYEGYIQEDLSISELALSSGISRQGVFDLVKRVEGLLRVYEEKLHLVEKFLDIKAKVEEINNSEDISKAKRIAEEILETL